MKRYCLTLDLKDDPELIQQYIDYHKNVWPEIKDSIAQSGIMDMEIYIFQNRLFMIMEVSEGFSFEEKAKADAENPKVQEWEELMWKYQQPLPQAAPGEKWILMQKIYDLQQD